MKKIIIIAAIFVSSGLTAYCLNTKQTKTVTAEATLKINKADFATTANGTPSNLGSAD
jgi:hypothetical protein